jgi:hypothetical protein
LKIKKDYSERQDKALKNKQTIIWNIQSEFCALFVLLAVSKKIEPSDVAKLNGYWEIEK